MNNRILFARSKGAKDKTKRKRRNPLAEYRKRSIRDKARKEELQNLRYSTEIARLKKEDYILNRNPFQKFRDASVNAIGNTVSNPTVIGVAAGAGLTSLAVNNVKRKSKKASRSLTNKIINRLAR